MPKSTGFDDTLDYKFIDPTNFEDADETGVTNARKNQLVNEALNVAVEAWLNQKAADTDQARADAMGVIPPPPQDPEADDPYEDDRAKQEQLLAAVASQTDRAAVLQKSFQRKRARLAAAAVTITASQIKDAKKQFLVGTTDTNGNPTGGYLARLETEFVNHRSRRQRALKALAMTGALALNDQEKANMQQEVAESEKSMEILRAVIATHRAELVNLGGVLPTKPPVAAQEPAEASEEPAGANRAEKRAASRNGNVKRIK